MTANSAARYARRTTLCVLSVILFLAPAVLAQDEGSFDHDAFRRQFQKEASWHRDDYQPGTISPQDAFDLVAELKGSIWVTSPLEWCFFSDGTSKRAQFELRDFSKVACMGEDLPGGIWNPCFEVSKKFDDYVSVVEDDAEVSVAIYFENDICRSLSGEEHLTIPEAKQIYNAFAELSYLSDNELDALIEANIDRQMEDAGSDALELEFTMMSASADFRESLSMLEELVAKWQAEAVGADTIAAPAPAVGLSFTSVKTNAVGLDFESTSTIESSVELDEERGYILREEEGRGYILREEMEIGRPTIYLLASKDYAGLFTGAVDASGLEMPEYQQMPATPLTWYPGEDCPDCNMWDFYPLVIGVPVSMTWESNLEQPGDIRSRTRTEEHCVAVGKSTVIVVDQSFDAVDVKCGTVTESEVISQSYTGRTVRNLVATKSISTEYGFVLKQADNYYDGVSSIREDRKEVTEVKTP